MNTLKVQDYLRSGKTISDLEAEFGIEACHHKELPLVILNYSQINSVKNNEIVWECRGLILEKNTWKLVSKAFDRFFNYGEMLDLHKDFDWSDFVVQEKIDGSLMSLWFYDGKWQVSTRGSFAQGKPCESIDKTWAELFWGCLKDSCPIELNLNKAWSYIFEFCSPYTKVVRHYDKPQLFLLSAFCVAEDWEHKSREMDFVDNDILDDIAIILGVNRPSLYEIKSIEDIQKFLEEHPESTFEGVVARDQNNMRIKAKNPRYLSLHRLKGNDNLFLPKNLLPFVLNGDASEVLTYFPECKNALDRLTETVYTLLSEAESLYDQTKNIENQKEFALKVKDSRVSSILFNTRKTGKTVKEILWDSPEFILRQLKGV